MKEDEKQKGKHVIWSLSRSTSSTGVSGEVADGRNIPADENMRTRDTSVTLEEGREHDRKGKKKRWLGSLSRSAASGSMVALVGQEGIDRRAIESSRVPVQLFSRFYRCDACPSIPITDMATIYALIALLVAIALHVSLALVLQGFCCHGLRGHALLLEDCHVETRPGGHQLLVPGLFVWRGDILSQTPLQSAHF